MPRGTDMRKRGRETSPASSVQLSDNSSVGGGSKKDDKKKKKKHTKFEDFDLDGLLEKHRRDEAKRQEELRQQQEEEEKRAAVELQGRQAKLQAELAAHVAKQAAEEVSKALIPVSNALTTAQVPKIHPLLASSAREARRVHVSGLPTGITKAEIKETFRWWSEVLRKKQVEAEAEITLPPTANLNVDTVLDVFISEGERPFAFVEFNTQDMPGMLISSQEPIVMSSYATGGSHQLTCKRPNNYKDMSAPDPGRVWVITPPDLEEDDYKQLFEQFGEVEALFYAPGKCVYVQYPDDLSGEKAIKALNGQLLNESTVLVVQAATAVERVVMQQAGFPVSIPEGVGATGMQRDIVKEILDLDGPATKALSILGATYPHLRTHGPIAVFPTSILVLYNLFEKNELEEDEDYYGLLHDISTEVERYGRVKEITVPRFLPSAPKPPKPPHIPDLPPPPPTVVGLLPLNTPLVDGGQRQSEGTGAAAATAPPKSAEQIAYEEAVEERLKAEADYEEAKKTFLRDRKQWEEDLTHPVKAGIGRVFIEYETVEEATNAQLHIAGKLFNGRTVITSFLFEDIMHPPTDEEEAQEGQESAEDRAHRMADLVAEEELAGKGSGAAAVPAGSGTENVVSGATAAREASTPMETAEDID